MRHKGLMVAVLGLSACGCTDDWERFRVIGQKLANRAPQAPQVKQVDWREAFDWIRSSLTENPAVHRVHWRLRFDKDLAAEPIAVVLKGPGRIELTGAVSTENQRVRAADIASRTAGVDEVVNSLSLGHGGGGADPMAPNDPPLGQPPDQDEKKPPV